MVLFIWCRRLKTSPAIFADLEWAEDEFGTITPEYDFSLRWTLWDGDRQDGIYPHCFGYAAAGEVG